MRPTFDRSSVDHAAAIQNTYNYTRMWRAALTAKAASDETPASVSWTIWQMDMPALMKALHVRHVGAQFVLADRSMAQAGQADVLRPIAQSH